MVHTVRERPREQGQGSLDATLEIPAGAEPLSLQPINQTTRLTAGGGNLMAEPGKITSDRTKSIVNLAEQMNRMWSNPGLTDTRRERIRNAYLQYQNNMLNSPTMQRSMSEAGVQTEQDRNAFLSSFGRGNEIQVPVAEYLRRRNNRRS